MDYSILPPATPDPKIKAMLLVPVESDLIDYTINCVANVIAYSMLLPQSADSELKTASLTTFVTNLLQIMKMDTYEVLVALVFVELWRKELVPETKHGWTCEQLFLTSLILSRKWVNDGKTKVATWSESNGMFTCAEIVNMEREFLNMVAYNLNFSKEQLLVHHASLMKQNGAARSKKLSALLKGKRPRARLSAIPPPIPSSSSVAPPPTTVSLPAISLPPNSVLPHAIPLPPSPASPSAVPPPTTVSPYTVPLPATPITHSAIPPKIPTSPHTVPLPPSPGSPHAVPLPSSPGSPSMPFLASSTPLIVFVGNSLPIPRIGPANPSSPVPSSPFLLLLAPGTPDIVAVPSLSPMSLPASPSTPGSPSVLILASGTPHIVSLPLVTSAPTSPSMPFLTSGMPLVVAIPTAEPETRAVPEEPAAARAPSPCTSPAPTPAPRSSVLPSSSSFASSSGSSSPSAVFSPVPVSSSSSSSPAPAKCSSSAPASACSSPASAEWCSPRVSPLSSSPVSDGIEATIPQYIDGASPSEAECAPLSSHSATSPPLQPLPIKSKIYFCAALCWWAIASMRNIIFWSLARLPSSVARNGADAVNV